MFNFFVSTPFLLLPFSKVKTELGHIRGVRFIGYYVQEFKDQGIPCNCSIRAFVTNQWPVNLARNDGIQVVITHEPEYFVTDFVLVKVVFRMWKFSKLTIHPTFERIPPTSASRSLTTEVLSGRLSSFKQIISRVIWYLFELKQSIKWNQDDTCAFLFLHYRFSIP